MNSSTGLPDLDNLLTGLLPGDNIVWRVDSIEDYKLYVNLLCRELLQKGSTLVYLFPDFHTFIESYEIFSGNLLRGY